MKTVFQKKKKKCPELYSWILFWAKINFCVSKGWLVLTSDSLFFRQDMANLWTRCGGGGANFLASKAACFFCKEGWKINFSTWNLFPKWFRAFSLRWISSQFSSFLVSIPGLVIVVIANTISKEYIMNIEILSQCCIFIKYSTGINNKLCLKTH